MASKSEDRAGPARVTIQQEMLLFVEDVAFQHWDEGVGGVETQERA